MKRLGTLRTAAVVGCALGCVGTALAKNGPHDGAIEARQGAMSVTSESLGTLGAMAKDERPCDAGLATHAAGNLDPVAKTHRDQWWPAGSDGETDGNIENDALPEIWENQGDLQSKFDDLTAAVGKLVPVAGGGVDELKGMVGDVGGACKACHDDYRAERR